MRRRCAQCIRRDVPAPHALRRARNLHHVLPGDDESVNRKTAQVASEARKCVEAVLACAPAAVSQVAATEF